MEGRLVLSAKLVSRFNQAYPKVPCGQYRDRNGRH